MKHYAITGRLINGIDDAAIEKGIVHYAEGSIIYAGPIESYTLPPETEVLDAGHGTILPGFIDCHTHVCGGADGNMANGRTNFDYLLTATQQIGKLLDAGFTFIRDMSIFGAPLARAVKRGEIRGPGIMPGGRVLSPTAGHVDMHANLPAELIQYVNPLGRLADGVEGCLRAVRAEFREGAQFIKICATGGVSSAVDGLDDVQFSDEEVAVITAEAARHGTYVAAHCSNAAGTLQALKNGVMCIEHGIDLNEDCLAIMKEKDIPVITTLFVSNLVANSTTMPAFMLEKGKKAAQSHNNSMLKARGHGLCIAYGTDFSDSVSTPYVGNGMEFQSIVNVGFSPMEAIKIGTINSAKVCKKADTLGSLEAGKQADIVIVDGNPLEDIACLTHSDHIQVVVKCGRIEKNTLQEA